MEKRYEKNLEKAKYLKDNLQKQYPEIFDDHEIDDLSQVQVCNLAEFLIAEHPEKYEKNRTIYEQDENLQRIYAVIHINRETNTQQAILINTAKDGKMSEGKFGTYDIEGHTFEASGIVKEEIVKYLGIGALDLAQQDEIVNTMFHDLDAMDKLATMDLKKVIDEKKEAYPEIQEMIDEKINQKNAENGISQDERKQVEESEQQKADKKENEKNSLVSPEMLRQAYLLGYTKVKGVVLTKGSEAADKIEMPGINRNAGNVTILRLKDSGKETDKYLAFQGNRLVVPGNKDGEIDKLLGKDMKRYKDGTLIKPLEIEDEEQYLDYDHDGVDINIKLQEGKDMSVDDLEEYKKKFKENMEKYFVKLYEIENDPLKSDAQKDKEYLEANKDFNIQNLEDAKVCNINIDDIKEINLETDERTKQQVDKEQDDEQKENGGYQRQLGPSDPDGRYGFYD